MGGLDSPAGRSLSERTAYLSREELVRERCVFLSKVASKLQAKFVDDFPLKLVLGIEKVDFALSPNRQALQPMHGNSVFRWFLIRRRKFKKIEEIQGSD